MGIREIWNSIETVLAERGFPLADADDVAQGKRCTIRVVEIPGEQQLRGTIGSGVVRLVFVVQIALVYEIGVDKRLERKIAEDAESVIAGIYGDVNLSNHHFTGATIDRDIAKGVVMNTMRFDFQSQATV